MTTRRGARILRAALTLLNAWVRSPRVLARVYLVDLQPIQWNENFG